MYRHWPRAGRLRKAAVATQGFRPEDAVMLSRKTAAGYRRRELLTAGAVLERLRGALAACA